MRIGKLAECGNCDVQTVRFYEREGLLDTPMRETNGYRRYTETHLKQLNFIRHCRSLGIGLQEVRLLRHFQADPELACGEVNRLIDRQIVRIRQQIESLRLLKEQLRALRRSCGASHKAGECGILRNLARAATGEGCPCHAAAGRPGEMRFAPSSSGAGAKRHAE
ncbi:MAG: Cd(II)/Pb(II)-responsive transcriptional regulator [Candidatus Accumulibacter sp.]|jgi:Cd(II)/Pb(II)-responsive transcriptional regulator|nr:Cd(II)/Pb(II)-responsive transcriptional regulator [Accumulibacter sp.]